MLSEALSAPTRTNDSATTLFMGGFLLLVSIVVPLGLLFAVRSVLVAVILLPLALLPPLVLRGYDVRTVGTGLRGETATPSFVDWSGLLRLGVKATLVGIGYALPLVVFFGLTVGSTVLLAADIVAADAPAGIAAALGIVLGSVAGFAYGFCYLYVRPAAIAVLAQNGRLRDAFAVRRVLRVARSGGFASGWLCAVFVLIGGLAVGVPLLLGLVGAFLVFYVRVVSNYLYGRGASGALDADTERAETFDSTATLSDRPPEVDPSVQTGRTVGDIRTKPVESDGGEAEPTSPRGGVGENTDGTSDREYTESASSTGSTESPDSTDEDDEFVWHRDAVRGERGENPE